MAVKISVDQVRAEIFKLTAGGGNANTLRQADPILVGIFQECFAQFLGHDIASNWPTFTAEKNEGARHWQNLLQERLYNRFIGPKLADQMIYLQHQSEQVLHLWEASKEMCRWIGQLLWISRNSRKQRAEAGTEIKLLINQQKKLSVKFKEKNWTEAVILTDIYNLVLKVPGKSYWCIVEMKFGDDNTAVDYVLACLYSQILLSQNPKTSGSIALVDFKPEKEERLLTATDLAEPQKSLKTLIGRLAGVLPG